MAFEICQSETGKYYFTLSIEPNAHKCGDYIEPAQISEYYKQHPDECAEPCTYCDAADFYDIYGYEMHAAAALIYSEEYAAEWLQKWQSDKWDTLSKLFFSCDSRGDADKYEEVQAIAAYYKAEPPKIEEIADIEQMQIEAERIAQQVGKQTARTCEYESDGDIIRNAIIPTFKGFGGGMDYVPALKAAISDIIGDRRKGGKRGAAAVLLAAYDTIVNTKMLSFVAWLELWGITDKGNYKRAKLRPADYMTKALKECPELQRILYP